MQLAKNICNIPEDLLQTQVLIEVIPDITLLGILAAITAITVLYWNKWRNSFGLQLLEYQRVSVAACMLIIFLPTWYSASGLIVNILTNLTNPEYAAIIKFNATCGLSK
jgi:hypothetical protein